MIEFTLIVAETSDPRENDDCTGRELRRMVSWPALPKTDDVVGIHGTDYPVTTVRHEINEFRIEVEVKAHGFDFTNLFNNSQWEKIGF
jgi:hypothetical protein